MARQYNGYEIDDQGNIIIDVTKQPRMEPNGPRIDVTQDPVPVVDAMTVKGGSPGEFRNYQQITPRAPGDFTERTVATQQGAQRIEAADRSLMSRGGDGLRIVDPGTPQDSFGMRGQAAGVSGDGRIVLSPEAIGELGRRQLQDEQASQAMEKPMGIQQINNRIELRSVLQKQADQGFVRPGTDQANRITMDQTTARAEQKWLNRARPRDVMNRVNTSDKIMAGADASRMTPQIMTQDGVAAGWDPVTQRPFVDNGGAVAIAAAKGKDNSILGMSDDDINKTLVSLHARKIGELEPFDKIRVDSLISQGKTKEAEDLKATIQKSKWSPDMEPFFQQYQDEWNRRKGIKGQAAPAAGVTAKPAAKASRWLVK